MATYHPPDGIYSHHRLKPYFPYRFFKGATSSGYNWKSFQANKLHKTCTREHNEVCFSSSETASHWVFSRKDSQNE